ncbi:MAG: hypothetical protein HC811_05885 [Flammeovirgaceae bacterium]|nr:hypothetical protein [Flammeovirgaceae bacterium]
MRLSLNNKGLMLVVGVLAAFIIIAAQTFYYQTQNELSKSNTEQSADEGSSAYVIEPADAVPGSAVEIQDQIPAELEAIDISEAKAKFLKEGSKVMVRYLKILFELIISPNAP